MSQRTGNHKKQQESALQKRKQQKKIAILLIVVVVLACAGGVAYTVYDNHKQEEARKQEVADKKAQMEVSRQETDASVVNVDAVLEYLSGLDTELLNEEIVPEMEEVSLEAVSGSSVQN